MKTNDFPIKIGKCSFQVHCAFDGSPAVYEFSGKEENHAKFRLNGKNERKVTAESIIAGLKDGDVLIIASKSEIRQRQIDHIKEHLAEFRSLTCAETVEEYFDEYFEKYEKFYGPGDSLYARLCSDLDLTPNKELCS